MSNGLNLALALISGALGFPQANIQQHCRLFSHYFYMKPPFIRISAPHMPLRVERKDQASTRQMNPKFTYLKLNCLTNTKLLSILTKEIKHVSKKLFQ